MIAGQLLTAYYFLHLLIIVARCSGSSKRRVPCRPRSPDTVLGHGSVSAARGGPNRAPRADPSGANPFGVVSTFQGSAYALSLYFWPGRRGARRLPSWGWDGPCRGRAAEDSSVHTTPGDRGPKRPTPPRMSWSFAGPFGKFDKAQLQRGFQVFSRGLFELPFDEGSGIPQPLRSRWAPALARRRSRRSPPNTRSRTARTTPATCSSGPAARRIISRGRSPTPRPRGPRSAACRPTCPCSPRRARSNGPSRISSSTAFTGYGELQGPDYIHAILNGYTKDDDQNYKHLISQDITSR